MKVGEKRRLKNDERRWFSTVVQSTFPIQLFGVHFPSSKTFYALNALLYTNECFQVYLHPDVVRLKILFRSEIS